MSNIKNGDGENIRAILDAQRSAFISNGTPNAQARIEWIDRVIGLLVDHEQQIVDAVAADFGHRSKDFSRVTEVASPIRALKQTKQHVAEWMRVEPRSSDTGQAWVQYQPLGVVGVVSPWNFPVNLAMTGLAGAIAAGNRVILKPSEFTPQTSELIAQMIRSAFREDEIAVVLGGPETSQAFCAQPFDHLLFTGATSIGKHVMRAAAENLVPVTLELGGKSPTIISRSIDLKFAVDKIVAGKAHNAGQICLAPDYVFVPEELADAFVEEAKLALAQNFPTLKFNPDYTSVINARHYERLQGYLAEARAAGVEVIELNPAGEDFSDQAHHKIPPTLLRNPGDELKVMQDEIFGPLLPFKTYRDIDEVVTYINTHPRPLGLYWFGHDAAEEALVLDRTTSGGVTINDVVKHVGVENLPFGGVGPSGMGAYHGLDGFRRFSHAKAVFRAADGMDVMRPPFSDANRELVGSLISR